MLKKLFTFGMATIMALGTTMSAFAAEPVNPEDPLAGKVMVSEERVPVEDEEGNTYYVVISEYVNEEDVKIGTRGIFPEYEVGTEKTFTVEIDNGDLGNISNGMAISATMLKQIALIVVLLKNEKTNRTVYPIKNEKSWEKIVFLLLNKYSRYSHAISNSKTYNAAKHIFCLIILCSPYIPNMHF